MTYSMFQKYIIDTRELINCGRNAVELRRLETLIRYGQVKAPKSVLEELSRVDDDIFHWADHMSGELFIELPDAALSYLREIVNKYGEPFRDPGDPGITYPGLVKYEGAGDADPEIVALAKNSGWIVVSEERGICGTCKIEQIKCITLKQLLDTEI